MLKNLIDRFKNNNQNSEPEKPELEKQKLPPFVDLAPTDQADENGIYSSALDEALDNDNICNIALSGPYGSGKSSIIKTYVASSNKSFLNVSLASFTNTGDSHKLSGNGNHSTDQQLVEKSILQQLLYGEAASKLPQSRFKRIHSPRYTLGKALGAVIWLLIAFYLFKNIDELMSLSLFKPGEGRQLERWFPVIFNSLAVAFLICGAVYASNHIIKTSSGLSLKRISLKNAEIEADGDKEESILNRHLDEIVYFFQQTDYDVVVFEDLDRFDNPDIFVKLREINTIVNSARKGKAPVKFLYALKDHIFKGRNRAKFFDFIIPVVPIINNTNSLDKIRERLQGTEIEERLEDQFLREVSLFLDDLRLIHNSINELRVYYSLLRSEKLDVTKLFALVIYKNVYPTDFENLHFRKGALYQILQLKDSLAKKLTTDLEQKANQLSNDIEAANLEKEQNVENLMRQYIGELARHIPTQYFGGIRIGSSNYTLEDLYNPENFEIFRSAGDLQYYNTNYRRPQALSISFETIKNKVDANQDFSQRVKSVENSQLEKKAELLAELNKVQEYISSTRLKTMRELLKVTKTDINALVTSHEIGNPALLSYLIGNGFLDETYHHYTSTFHEGRMSAHDRDFVLAIRSFNPVAPNYKIDNAEETIASLRASDFYDPSTLNTSIIQFILKHPTAYSSELNASVTTISKNFSDTESFFENAFREMPNIEKFIRYLFKNWDGYPDAAASSKHGVAHFKHIVNVASLSELKSLLQGHENAHSFIETNLGQIYDSEDETVLDKLAEANFLVRQINLSSYEKKLIDGLLDRRMYRFNIDNVNFLIGQSPEFADMPTDELITLNATSNFSCVLRTEDEELIALVESNFENYVKSIVLSESNVDESESAVLHILKSKSLSRETKIEVLDHVSTRIADVVMLPSSLRVYSMSNRTTPYTWKNILTLIRDELIPDAELVELLNSQEALEGLRTDSADTTVYGSSDVDQLRDFVFSSDKLDISAFESFLNSFSLEVKSLPEGMDSERIEALLDNDAVALNEATFSKLEHDDELLTHLLKNRVSTFTRSLSSFPATDDIKLSVAISIEDNDASLTLLKSIDQSLIVEERLALKKLAELLSSGTNPLDFEAGIIAASLRLGTNEREAMKILALVAAHWSWDEIKEILIHIGGSYRDIAKAGYRPTIPDTRVNREFISEIIKRGFVSSSTESWRGIKVNTRRTHS